MLVLLKQDVNGTGKAGDIVKVSDGYARNMLLPKGLAVEATEGNIRAAERQKEGTYGGYESIEKNGISFTSAILARETMRRDIVSVLHNAREEGIDAMIFPSNAITVDGLSAINELGFAIPEDLAVVGFDQEDRSEMFNPWFSFVNQPTKLVAEYSFRMLLGAIKGDGQLETKIINPLYTLGSRIKK